MFALILNLNIALAGVDITINVNIKIAIPANAETPKLTINKTIPMIIGTGNATTRGKNPKAKSILDKSALIKEIILPLGYLYLVSAFAIRDLFNKAFVKIVFE